MISLIFLALFALVPSTRPRLTRRDYGFLFVCGLLAVPGAQLPVVQAQYYLTPPLVSLLVTTGPAFAALLGIAILKEKLTRRQVLGIVIALTGAVIVIVVGSKRTAITRPNPWGASLAAFAQLCWAAYTVLSKRLSERFQPVTAVGVAVIAGTLTMLPLYPHTVAGLGEVSVSQWLWLLYLAVGGTVVPYLIWFRSLTVLPASTTAAYMYLVPLFALFWSWTILRIVPRWGALIGGLVIIVGVALTQYSRSRAPAPQTQPAGGALGEPLTSG